MRGLLWKLSDLFNDFQTPITVALRSTRLACLGRWSFILHHFFKKRKRSSRESPWFWVQVRFYKKLYDTLERYVNIIKPKDWNWYQCSKDRDHTPVSYRLSLSSSEWIQQIAGNCSPAFSSSHHGLQQVLIDNGWFSQSQANNRENVAVLLAIVFIFKIILAVDLL